MVGWLTVATPALAGQAARLDEHNWDLVPGGKEVDAIYGDYLLKNDKVVAVIGDTVPGRHANLTTKEVQGALLDFALLETNNDQLTAFAPHAFAGTGPAATKAQIVTGEGPEVRLRVIRPAGKKEPIELTTDYVLRDGDQHITVTTTRKNTSDKTVKVRTTDRMKCESPFVHVDAGRHELAYYYNRWFLAAYGIVRPGADVQVLETTVQRGAGLIGYPGVAENPEDGMADLAPGAELSLTRCIIAGRDTAEVQRVAAGILKLARRTANVKVVGPDNQPVGGVNLTVSERGHVVSEAVSDSAGNAAFALPPESYELTAEQLGRVTAKASLDLFHNESASATMMVGPRSAVNIAVSDGGDGSPACKAQFIGINGTPEPMLGPKERANGCRNIYYSAKGEFSVPLPPGDYYVILSRGPECDAAYRTIKLNEGESVSVAAPLRRVVKSDGWISTDFHNHSTESGDNATETESRLISLVAEGVEFAASTEHQRIQTYRERMAKLGIEKVLATSDGMELTGTPLPLDHQNAFPLIRVPRTQDNGGPKISSDPLKQIKRLRAHDSNSDKLVQQNHPDIGWLVYDKNGDGQPDAGFGSLDVADVVEVHGGEPLAGKGVITIGKARENNVFFNWLQLLNQGRRIPGVFNTDAHYCFHDAGSGTLRNYVKSPTDDPAQVKEMDVVREARAGHIVMTNGPFMEVGINDALPGDVVTLSAGQQATLRIKVQCPNWLDVDRVQVLLNGRMEPAMNFTRANHPERFGSGVVKFEAVVPVPLEADTHIIVVASGEHSSTGPVMGLGDRPIVASNPIYVDVDGNGFTANKDTLDEPLPTKLQPVK